MDYKVESGIEPASGKWRILAMRMRPGDSVLVEDKNKAINLSRAIRMVGARPLIRKQYDGTGFRVWAARIVYKTKPQVVDITQAQEVSNCDQVLSSLSENGSSTITPSYRFSCTTFTIYRRTIFCLPTKRPPSGKLLRGRFHPKWSVSPGKAQTLERLPP